MKRILENRIGFTLVELMVVVVVLGILSGIAVQRMGDVRRRTEEAAEEANLRLLLGAANLALTRNYGDYMYYHMNPPVHFGTYWRKNSTLRWQRPCEKTPVTQFLTQGHGTHLTLYRYHTGYNYTEGNFPDNFTSGTYTWNDNQFWNLTDYFESFPIGYAVEIVFAARDEHTGEISPTNATPYKFGYHEDRDTPSNGTFTNPYDKDQILIYKFVGDKHDQNDSFWNNWNDLEPGGVLGPYGTGSPPEGYSIGYDYPYVDDDKTPLDYRHWRLIFPN